MTLTRSKKQKAAQLSQAIQEYLLSTGQRDAKPADLVPHLVERGLFNKEYERPGLPLRNFLKSLDESEQLDLLPQASWEYRGKRRYWFFNPVTDQTPTEDPLGETLEKQVAQRLRERGLVVWLDREGLYTEFVDGLAHRHRRGKFFAPVVTFRGSFLDTLMALESQADGLDPEPLLLHVPGHTDTTIRSTPLLELYKAGTRYERALDTLVREVAAGQVAPEETERFLEQTDLTLGRAQEWLGGQRPDKVVGLAGQLRNLQPEWVLESLVEPESDLRARVVTASDLADLKAYLARHTGFSEPFAVYYLGKEPAGLKEVTEGFIGWLLCVEYVHDLKRKVTQPELAALHELSAPLKKTSKRLVDKLRQRYPDLYRDQALQGEHRLAAELEAGDACDLGKIDTFSAEDTRLLRAAVAALVEQRWNVALRWATERLESPSVWVKNEVKRRHEWTLVKSAARLGQALVSSERPLNKVETLAAAVERYTGSGKSPRTDGAQAVDLAHRKFEQERLRLLDASLPNFGRLHNALSQLRGYYRQWVDQLTRDFAMICANSGFLPEPALQQRTLYEQVVHPLTQREQGRVAFFLVDALRYEMACELANSLQEQATTVHLKPRLAELPSITSVGMNVLAPVCRDGKLSLGKPFKGFRAGEYTVSSNQHRLRAMGERSLERLPGARRTPVAFKLQDLGHTNPDKLKKKVKEAALIVVHSREIDSGGEADVGLAGFDHWVGQLRSAVLNLRSAGVEEFVITSDHGFLLLDDSAPPVTYNAGTVDRRYILTDQPIIEDDMNTVALESLGYSGYKGHLMFLRDTKVFDTKGKSARTFVHGGNSLQERVIPVLNVSFRPSRALELNKYRLEAVAKSPVMGCSRVVVTLKKINEEEGLLDFAVGEKVTVALRAVGVSAQVVIKAAPEAEVLNQQLLLEEGQPTEVYFTISGSGAAKAALELYHPDGVKAVESCQPKERFPVDVVAGSKVPEPAPAEAPTDWEVHLGEAERDIFLHIEKHGSITELEVIGKLGTARKARRFANEFHNYVELLPFHVRIEAAATGKRWVKGLGES